MTIKDHLAIAMAAAFLILSAFVIADELRWRAETSGCERQQADPRFPPVWLCNGVKVSR